MRVLRFWTAIILLLLPTAAWADQVKIEGLRMWPAPDNTRLVFDVSDQVEHRLFTLANPDRIVIDLKGARLATPIDPARYRGDVLKGIRTAVRGQDDLRVVLDLESPVRPKSFVLRPNSEYGHRLVVDLNTGAPTQKSTPVRQLTGEGGALRDIVVAIDAGHGGEDPGAMGPGGTREKDVVLAIARRLEALVNKEPGMRAVMIRDGDYYVGLINRMSKAREMRADLFVSIHADSFRDKRASGASVYTLSQRGASSEYARLLADKENAADLVGGVSLDDKDELLASVLLDLSQTATMEASTEAAAAVLSNLKGVSRLHKHHVEHAGFRVLKSPDVPSMLVETAFISNPREERLLRSSRHQYAMAKGIMKGIRSYFRNNPPPGTRLAQRERRHIIDSGDTLTAIADRYRIPLDTLRSANGIKDDMLRVGEVLTIPPG